MPVKLSARTDTDDLNQKLAELHERNEVPCVAATTIPHALVWSGDGSHRSGEHSLQDSKLHVSNGHRPESSQGKKGDSYTQSFRFTNL
jgi:hypothetical protein